MKVKTTQLGSLCYNFKALRCCVTNVTNYVLSIIHTAQQPVTTGIGLTARDN